MAETHGVERGIYAISLQQFRVRALFYDTACLQHNDAVSSLNGREAVSDNEGCTSV
jgi:hypothetical protein